MTQQINISLTAKQLSLDINSCISASCNLSDITHVLVQCIQTFLITRVPLF